MALFKKRHFIFSNALFLVCFCITLILMTSNGIILYRGLYDYIEQETNSNHLSNLESTAKKLEQNLQRANQAASMLAQNDEFIQYLKRAGTSDQADLMMRNMFYRYTYANDSVSSLVIVTKNGALLSTDTSVTLSYDEVIGNEKLLSMLESAEPVLFLPTGQQSKPGSIDVFQSEKTLFFGVPINENGERIAFMLIILKNGFINSSINESMAVRYNDSGIIASSQELPQKYITELKTMDTGTVYGKSASYYGTDFYDGRFTLFYIYPKEMLFTRLQPVIFVFIGIFLLSIGAAFFITRLLSKILVNPLHQLNKTLNSYMSTKKERFAKFFWMHSKYLTFRETIMISFVFAVFLPLLIFDLLYIPLLKNTVNHYLTEQTTISYEKTYNNLTSYLTNKQNCLRTIGSDYRIQATLYDTIYRNEPDNVSQNNNFYAMLEAYQILFSNNDLLYLSDQKGNLLFSTSHSNPLFSAYEITIFVNTETNYSWRFGQKNSINQEVFGYFYRITNIQMGGTLGTIQCVVQESDLHQNYDNQNTQYTDYYLIDETGTVISSTQTRQIGSIMKVTPNEADPDVLLLQRESKELVITRLIPATGLWFVMHYGLDSLNVYITAILHQQLIIMTAFLSIIVAFAYYFSIRLTKPLKEFYHKLENIGLEFDGIFSLLPDFPEDSAIIEINQLGKSFNEMSERIELLLDEIITFSKKQGELETKKKTAEILALQSQINSHFLYNTFENINSCISTGQSEIAVIMINSLSSLLRYSSKVKHLLVPLIKELSCLEKYLFLMGVRFEGKIRFVNEIGEEYNNLRIVRLTLQPIVENAIGHGLWPKENGGTITLRVLEQEDFLEIQVMDDGAGIEADHLTALNAQLHTANDFEHVGIFNVNNRIKMALGSEYGLTIESTMGQGTLVRIKLPKAFDDYNDSHEF